MMVMMVGDDHDDGGGHDDGYGHKLLLEDSYSVYMSVSYTHLTLPTRR